MFKIFSGTGGYDYIIVGLGNPGKEYEKTRHNIGFCFVDKLCDINKVECKKNKFKGLTGDLILSGKRCLILKPQTFMNLSGQSVAEAMKFYKIPAERVIVVFDDISLDAGRLRIRAKGSAGGHNGIKDIIAKIGCDTFPRIKIGVGKKPHPDYDLKDWVLGKFPKNEEIVMEKASETACFAVECIIKNGIAEAMNRYNG